MSSAVNLLDKQVLVELRHSQNNTFDTVEPTASFEAFIAPPNNNLYKNNY